MALRCLRRGLHKIGPRHGVMAWGVLCYKAAAVRVPGVRIRVEEAQRKYVALRIMNRFFGGLLLFTDELNEDRLSTMKSSAGITAAARRDRCTGAEHGLRQIGERGRGGVAWSCRSSSDRDASQPCDHQQNECRSKRKRAARGVLSLRECVRLRRRGERCWRKGRQSLR